MTNHSTSASAELSTHPSKFRQWLLALLGVLVIIPSVINASTDIFKAISNSPIGKSEIRNSELMKRHWEDAPLFKKDIEIRTEHAIKILKIRVFENADIWVQYDGQEQWLESQIDIEQAARSFSLISSAVAAPERLDISRSKQARPVLKQEEERVTVDLDRVQQQRAEALQVQSDVIERAYQLYEQYSQHKLLGASTKTISETYNAEPGHVITDVRLDIMSQNRASKPEISIAGDRKSVTVKLQLESGPVYDQWRGWIKAEVVTQQKAN